MALHTAQHERQRCRGRERDECQDPVVGQHHTGHHHHQGAVEQPGECAPREELRQRLDIAGDPGDETATALLAMVGETQPVDVVKELDAQGVERLFAARAESVHCGSLSHGGDDDDEEADDAQHHDDADIDLAVLEAAVDCLLHEDRYDDSTRRTDHRERKRRADPASKCGRRFDTPADHLDRRPPADRFVVDRPRHALTSVECSARSCSKASINSRYSGTVTNSSSCRPWATTRPSARYSTSSANAIVDGREATATTVASLNVCRRLASTRASVPGSSDDVVSSSNKAAGLPTSARANAIR